MYRIATTGEVVSQGELRRRNPETSLPAVFDTETLDFLGVAVVFETPAPQAGELEVAYQDGVEKDAKGNWVVKWSVRPMFADVVENGTVVKTKADQEAEFLASKAQQEKSQNAEKFQAALDAFAKERDYDSINDAVSYIDSNNAEWALEAAHAKTLRDQAWTAFYANQPLPSLTWGD